MRLSCANCAGGNIPQAVRRVQHVSKQFTYRRRKFGFDIVRREWIHNLTPSGSPRIAP
jgi:hypothetical protein